MNHDQMGHDQMSHDRRQFLLLSASAGLGTGLGARNADATPRAPASTFADYRPCEHPNGTTLPVHPTQIYESIGQLVLFLVLLYARRFRRFHGQIFALWLMCYAVLRTSVELLRGDTERGTLNGLLNSLGARGLADSVPLEAWYNISTSQFISLCMFTFGATLLYRRIRRAGEAAGVGPTPSPA